MITKPGPTDAPMAAIALPSPVKTFCGNCGVEETRFLHHVRHRGIFRRLCTTCVLRLHPQSFCPSCFDVYEQPHRSPPDSVTCYKCYSTSHRRCVGPNPTASPYICPLCSVPGSTGQIFCLTFVKKEGTQRCLGIDKKAAIVLLAAAKIAASSMNKAAVAAKAEAERRAKEAAFTRKRAREALEHLASLVAKEKLKKRELLALGELSGSGGNMGQQEKKYGKTVKDLAIVETPAANQGGSDRMDRSSEVLAAFNAVELSEKDRVQSSKTQNDVSQSPKDGVPMDVEVVEESVKYVASHSSNGETLSAQNRAINNDNDWSGNSGHTMDSNARVEDGNNLVPAVPAIGDQVLHLQSNHVGEENIGLQQ